MMDLHKVDSFMQRFVHGALTHKFFRSVLIIACFLTYCELIHYFVVLLQCTWPATPAAYSASGDGGDLKVMFLADTHLLGFREGHWFDKVRREYQMKRAFQTSMLIHKPDVVFVLGDLFDEGKWCDNEEFDYHVQRFQSMFAVPEGTELHVMSGNHDEGFHYMMNNHKHERFEKAFASPSVRMLRIKGNTFVLVNSMAMEGDGCSICSQAEKQLHEISKYLLFQLKCEKSADEECSDADGTSYTQPILLQHFPMYRRSDAGCSTEDSAPPERKNVPFRPKMDCLDQRSSRLLFSLIQPRLIVSAHTHDGCYRIHPNKVPEWSVSSFSWRNRNNPTFLMSRITNMNYTTSQCFMPQESTVINLYIVAAIVVLVSLLWPTISYKYRQKIC